MERVGATRSPSLAVLQTRGRGGEDRGRPPPYDRRLGTTVGPGASREQPSGSCSFAVLEAQPEADQEREQQLRSPPPPSPGR